MSSWATEYLGALACRDAKELSQLAIINAYSKLADRTAASKIPVHVSEPTSTKVLASEDTRLQSIPSTGRFKIGREKEQAESPSDTLARLRIDLSVTQRSRAELQKRSEELSSQLETSKTRSETQSKRVEDLLRDKTTLERRYKDLTEEIKGKAKLIEDVQDEMISLNLQLNMAEQRCKKLVQENQELVDRWMARMGLEADAMNERSKWT